MTDVTCSDFPVGIIMSHANVILSWQKCGVCGADGAGVEFGAVANAKVHYMGRAHKKATKLWLDKWATANRR